MQICVFDAVYAYMPHTHINTHMLFSYQPFGIGINSFGADNDLNTINNCDSMFIDLISLA